MVRVGVDENLAQELLADFPPEAQIIRRRFIAGQPLQNVVTDAG